MMKALRNRKKASRTDSLLNTVEKEIYQYRAGRRGIKGSLDQYGVMLDTIQDVYFNAPDDGGGLYFSKRPSALNVILHFTKDKLVVDDGTLLCRYRSVDEWHEATSCLGEDLFTTAYLAAFDLYRGVKPRNYFLWSPYLDVETNDVNSLFRGEISELHAHLKGSSMNFELSWLSLMNYPCHREKDYLTLFKEKRFQGTSKKGRDLIELYHNVSLAVAIRYYLFELMLGLDTRGVESEIDNMLGCDNISELQPRLNTLSAYIWSDRSEYGRIYEKIGENGVCPDYAINDETYNIYSVLSGERRILYNSFRAAYDGNEKVAMFLYAYLVFKQQLREKIIQMNEVVGFANFDIYEKRKSCFIPDGSKYEKLLAPMAFLNFLHADGNDRYIEGRVTPKDTVVKDSVSVRTMDRNVAEWIRSNRKDIEGNKQEKVRFNGHYIFHFIKSKDDTMSMFGPRHNKLRKQVKKQAIALYEYRSRGYVSALRVVGIDAANSEIMCRPEVFAQAFRFLRRHTIKENVESHPTALGMTYHVGEDFYDIVDGLRAVDEVLTFMNFRSNDRIGHALVLGTDVARYYESRGKSIQATRQVLLDNFVWLYVCVASMKGRVPLCEYLENEARILFRQIYGNSDVADMLDIRDYYESWLRRGDDPESSFKDLKTENSLSEWGKSALNYEDKEVCRARLNDKAKALYYEYHYNKVAKEEGRKAVIFHIAHNYYKEFVEMVDEVRESLLCKIERLHIAIECNPSSNLRIGEMTSYIEHPIFRFNNYGLNTPYPPHDISVSINTDDSGVFATSLEREYALMGIALEKTDDERFRNSPRAVKEWLDRVRRMSVEQRFKK